MSFLSKKQRQRLGNEDTTCKRLPTWTHLIFVRKAVENATRIHFATRQQVECVALVLLCEAPQHDHLVIAREAQMARVSGPMPILVKMRESGWRSNVEVWPHEWLAQRVDGVHHAVRTPRKDAWELEVALKVGKRPWQQLRH